MLFQRNLQIHGLKISTIIQAINDSLKSDMMKENNVQKERGYYTSEEIYLPGTPPLYARLSSMCTNYVVDDTWMFRILSSVNSDANSIKWDNTSYSSRESPSQTLFYIECKSYSELIEKIKLFVHNHENSTINTEKMK